MTAFTFETITAAQALAFGAGDTLAFSAAGAVASAVQVGFTPAGAGLSASITLTFGGVSKTFGAGLAGLGAGAGQITFPDGSRLFVGTTGADAVAGTSAGDEIGRAHV